MTIVPLKVTIGREGGRNVYPKFNRIDPSLRGETDWSHFIDQNGSGWLYDKKSGHDDDDAYSSRGTWIGIVLVPRAFADAAVQLFPVDCEICSREECEWFYDERIGSHAPAYVVDESVVRAVEARRAAGMPITNEDRDALDPEMPRPGIVRNTDVTWQGYASRRGLQFDESTPSDPGFSPQ